MRAPLPVVLAVLALSPLARADSLVEITQSVGLGQPAGSPASHQLIAGLVAGDVDGDGRPDLLSIGGGLLQFRRGLAGGFAPPTELAGLDRQRTYEGLTLADVDGDGDLDLFVCGRGASHLFLFQGGRFTDVTATHLPYVHGHVLTALPVDLDRDGDLDLVLSRYVDISSFPFHRCATNAALENAGGGRFVLRALGGELDGVGGCTFMTVAHDLDGDQRPELFEINDFSQAVRGHAVWVEDGRDAGGWPLYRDMADVLDFHAPGYGMGLAIGDVDGDGRVEYVVSNIGQPIALSFDRARERFLPFSVPPVRYAAEDLVASWTAAFADLDGDGAPELVLPGSALSAAAMVANADPPESPVLSWRDGAWAPWERRRAFGPARDVIFLDLDADGLDEALTIDRSGAVRAWRLPQRDTRPVSVHLHPTLTASAWGARVVASCGESRVEIAVNGGDRYGQSAEARLSLPLPAACLGAPVPLEVRWPSGWRDAALATPGTPLHLVEPRWQFVDLAEPAGPALVLPAESLSQLGLASEEVSATAGAGLDVGPVQTTPSGDLRFPFRHITDAGSPAPLDPSPWIGLLLGEPTPRAIHRVPELAPDGGHRPLLWSGGAPLVSGFAVNGFVATALAVSVETASAVHDLDTLPVPGGQAFVYTPDPEHLALRVGPWRFALEVAPDHDLDGAVFIAKDHVFTAATAANRLARVRVRLMDAAGRPTQLAPARLDLSWRSTGESLGAPRAEGGGFYIWELARSGLGRDDTLVATVDGHPVPGEVRPARLSSATEIGALVDPSSSRCTLSEPWLDDTPGDLGTLLATFRDANGHELSLLGLNPGWSMGGGLAPIVGGGTTATGFLQTAVVVSPDAASPGSPAVRIGSMSSPIACAATRRPFTTQPFMPSLSTLRVASPPPLEVDEVAPFVVIPRAPSGRAIGAGLDLEVRSCGDEDSPTADLASPPLYQGGGRYGFSLVPRGQGRLCVGVGLAGDGGGGLVRATVSVVAEVPEPGPEPGPEPTEDGTDDAEPAPDEDPEGGSTTEVVSPSDAASDEGEPAHEGDVADDGLDLQRGDTPLDTAAAEQEDGPDIGGRSGGSGCRGGPALPWPLPLLWPAALYVLSLRRRRR